MTDPFAAPAPHAAAAAADVAAAADLERRFGGLRRLYGDAGYARLRAAAAVVVGLGGVGSWAAEALARSGVARLVLVDPDHVGESNINRQVQALGATLGCHKGDAMRERIADIHPGCDVLVVDAFVDAGNWPALLPPDTVADGVIDACDQAAAKAALAIWSRRERCPLVSVGAAGGKREPQRVEVADLAAVTHDPLLASVRQRLRRQLIGAPGKRLPESPRTHTAAARLGVRCVFSREPVAPPDARCDTGIGAGDGSLNCHGYGSSVAVTATFGMVAAAELIAQWLAQPPVRPPAFPAPAGIETPPII